MKTTVQFKNFEGFEHIRTFVEDLVDQALARFESSRHLSAHVILGTVKAGTHKPIFECEFLIKGTGIRSPIIIKKKDSDFYQALRSCISASEKSLRRISKIRVSSRRRLKPISISGPDKAFAPRDDKALVA